MRNTKTYIDTQKKSLKDSKIWMKIDELTKLIRTNKRVVCPKNTTKTEKWLFNLNLTIKPTEMNSAAGNHREINRAMNKKIRKDIGNIIHNIKDTIKDNKNRKVVKTPLSSRK